jgi:hypothetical protein
MVQRDWRGPLYELSEDGMRAMQVPGSEATVSRDDDGISYRITTSGLTPGNAYTVWVMAFNNPSACAGADAPEGYRCGGSDMGTADAGFSLSYGGDGKFAESETVTFEGRVAKGDTGGVELDTGPITDPGGAEVHIRIRDHGPAQPGMEEDQIRTLQGGCTEDAPPGGGGGKRGTYPCRDVQATGI